MVITLIIVMLTVIIIIIVIVVLPRSPGCKRCISSSLLQRQRRRGALSVHLVVHTLFTLRRC